MHSTTPLGRERQRLQRAASVYLQSCFDQEIPPRASKLARQLDMSFSTFTKRFRAALGVAPGHYLKSRQVARAEKLLASTRMPTTKIGYCSAFHTRSTFFRVFRRFTGMTPGEYRCASERARMASGKK